MIIGVTGSFGSGKTTAAKFFKKLGAYIIDADKVYGALIRPDKKCCKKIVKYFGKTILKKDGRIDRPALGQIVFKEKKKLKLLNKITHPEIIKEIKHNIGSIKSRVIIIDAALLVETLFYKKLDGLIVIKTKESVLVNRLLRDKKLTKEDILRRIRLQAPLKKKLAAADFIIDNSGTKKQTLSQVMKIWKQIRSESCL